MGLFEFLKKKKTDSAMENEVNSSTSSQTSVFKGDLAFYGEKPNPNLSTVNPSNEKPPSYGKSHDADSKDSEVYMSFENKTGTFWSCPECGTRNDILMTGCVVCGLKK